MSDYLSAGCATDNEKANLASNDFLSTSRTIICIRTYRDNLYITVDLQGDTRQPPRLEFVVSGK